MKVLIIDDDDDIRLITSMSLGLLGGATVFEANNGADGVAKAQEHSPDVILLDMIMPEMDGAQTISMLRNNEQTAAIPVIFITTRAFDDDIEQMLRMGAKAVLTKPFDPTSLATKIRDILSR